MTAIPVFNAEGVKTGELAVDPALFDKTVRRGLLKEALIAYLASQRQGTHKNKDRGEVAGGGRKPWRQKGTGRARQGSTRSPQWVGGGRAHAVRPRDYAYQLPRGQRELALLSSLRYRLEKNAVCAVEGLDGLTEPKTKAVAAFLGKTGLEGKRALLVSEGNLPNLHLSTRNIPKVTVSERRNLNAGVVLTHANLVFTKSAIEALVKELKG
ncbi:MAG: 50S ribosomal protein L4 [Planctomycetes bacterium]|jgi:large subunit ribosomal protein L4|nr:50S ribosomal protein L4 [Planctomycetota bacterium]